MPRFIGDESDDLVQPREVVIGELDSRFSAVRCPTRPDYYWGNYLRVEAEWRPDCLASWKRRWLEAFPETESSALRLQSSQEASVPAEADAAAREHGLDLERLTVLQLRKKSFLPRPLPHGSGKAPELRPVRNEAEWQAVESLQIAGAAPVSAAFDRFVRWRYAAYRATLETLQGGWWGAFVGDELVAGAGIVWANRRARFQEVVTAAPHRRKGIATALCSQMLSTFFVEVPDGQAVIVAETSSSAERIYRRLGFSPVEFQLRWTARSAT